jgi:hypothetical protein
MTSPVLPGELSLRGEVGQATADLQPAPGGLDEPAIRLGDRDG